MRCRLPSIVAMLAITTSATAQDRSGETAKLRAELAAARATITRLEARLDEIDAGAVASPREPPGGRPRGEELPPLDFTDVAEETAAAAAPAQTDAPTWEYGPPGPIGLPLSPPGEEYAAGAELVTGSGSGVATFSITHSKDGPGTPLPDGSTSVVNDTLTLSASAPLGKDGTTPFATLDGLVAGTKVSLGFTRFAGRIPSQEADDRDPDLIAARARCAESSPSYAAGCVRVDDAFLERFMSPEERRRYESNYGRASIQQGLSWSLRAAVGYDEFTYYSQPVLQKDMVDRIGWSVGGQLMAYPARGLANVVALDYQRSFKAAQAVTTCPLPAAGQKIVSCVPGPIEGPTRSDKLILAPEVRFLLPVSRNGIIRSLGFGPRLEVDLLGSELAFDLPVYLASDPKTGLNGGIRAGYVTDGDDFRIGVFVGKSFSLFK